MTRKPSILSLAIGAVFLLVLGGIMAVALGVTNQDSQPQEQAAPAPQTASFDPTLNNCATGTPPASEPRGVLSLGGSCLGSGDQVTLAELAQGRPLVVNIWAYWCGPCRAEMPILQEFATAYGDQVATVGIHADIATGRGIGFATEMGIDFPLIADTTGAYLAALQVPKVIPLTVVISADGEIKQIIARPVTSLNDLTSQVNTALGLTLS